MPASTDETIGTGETYTTIVAWEADLGATLSSKHTGRCKGESFYQVVLSGHTTDVNNYYELEGKAGARHDGRAHEVSAAGNARIEWDTGAHGLHVGDEFVRIRWLELKGPGATNSTKAINTDGLTTCTVHIHHLIIHNNITEAVSGQTGILAYDSDATHLIFANTIYGMGDYGIDLSVGNADDIAILNTCFENNNDGILSQSGNVVESNACFENTNDDLDGAGTENNNATSDATGEFASLTTADQFVAPTTTFGSTDLRIKAGSDLADKSDTYSTTTYPEIDISIASGTRIGTWDVGSDDELVGASISGTGGAGVGGVSSASPYIYGA
jgi:hypothetical protein